MPEILKLDPTQYTLRHVRAGNPLDPSGQFAMGPLQNSSPVTLLGETMSFVELPISELITSPDLVNGTDTARLGDAGTWQLQFPNKIASDGIAWKDRFTDYGRNDWVEIRRGSHLEFVGCIETCTPDYQSVTIAGHDGFWCLKNAYERDWQCLQGPRDVMEHASRVAVPELGDSLFSNTINSAIWTTAVTGSGSVTSNTATGAVLTTTAAHATATLESLATLPMNERWALSVDFSAPLGTVPFGTFSLTVLDLAFADFAISINDSGVDFTTSTGQVQGPFASPLTTTNTLIVEYDGRWVRVYVNGQLMGYLQTTMTAERLGIQVAQGPGSGTHSLSVSNVVFEAYPPFLMVGTDQGDYVLPGTAQTYPTGGLHARYYSDVAIGGLPSSGQLPVLLNPGKDNPASGQPAPYDVVEVVPLNSNSPTAHTTSGFAATNWSMKQFGAIYLGALTAGNYQFIVASPAGGAIRVWIGTTEFGTQLVDVWTATGLSPTAFTLNSASLANGDGVIENGWYPIIVEYAAITATTGPNVFFYSIPGSYTDPGGSAIGAGSYAPTGVGIPPTSVSPLGCVDQRYQGVSFFDMYQQTGNAFGYQFTCEPQSLESGSFPGLLAPRLRQGHDTDVVLQADMSDGVEPVLNYKNESDATDQCSSMFGIGAGINDGQGSQLQVQVFDFVALASSLFDLQGWVDASDVSYPALLQQRVASLLALQSTPWSNVTGDPRAMDRLADTFPLSNTLSEMHWLPGDGVRFYLPDVNVIDSEPRQMTQVTRAFGPTGRTSSEMTPGVAGNLLRRPT